MEKPLGVDIGKIKFKRKLFGGFNEIDTYMKLKEINNKYYESIEIASMEHQIILEKREKEIKELKQQLEEKDKEIERLNNNVRNLENIVSQSQIYEQMKNIQELNSNKDTKD